MNADNLPLILARGLSQVIGKMELIVRDLKRVQREPVPLTAHGGRPKRSSRIWNFHAVQRLPIFTLQDSRIRVHVDIQGRPLNRHVQTIDSYFRTTLPFRQMVNLDVTGRSRRTVSLTVRPCRTTVRPLAAAPSHPTRSLGLRIATEPQNGTNDDRKYEKTPHGTTPIVLTRGVMKVTAWISIEAAPFCGSLLAEIKPFSLSCVSDPSLLPISWTPRLCRAAGLVSVTYSLDAFRRGLDRDPSPLERNSHREVFCTTLDGPAGDAYPATPVFDVELCTSRLSSTTSTWRWLIEQKEEATLYC